MLVFANVTPVWKESLAVVESVPMSVNVMALDRAPSAKMLTFLMGAAVAPSGTWRIGNMSWHKSDIVVNSRAIREIRWTAGPDMEINLCSRAGP
jgi:hypothetical protein